LRPSGGTSRTALNNPLRGAQRWLNGHFSPGTTGASVRRVNLEFRLLGTLEVEGGAAALGSGKQRAMLAYLLLRRNDAVPREALVDALWGEDPPATAAHALDVYASRVRKTLGGDGLLESRGGSFRLNVPDESVDVGRFERLLAEVRGTPDPGQRLAAADQALALWRGRALADVLDEPFARPESERLEEERLVVAEERFDALLALGRHDETIGELQAFVREHPLRDRPRRELMLALYRAGRQSEALEVYREGRTILRDELGLDPSRELRELEAAILNQDERLAAPSGRETPAPARAGRARARAIAGRGHRALLALCLGIAAAAGIVAGVLLLTTGSPHLSRIDFNGIGAIDPRSGRIVSEVIPAARPGRLAVVGNVVWTANQSDDTVSRIDQSTARVVQTIPVGSSPSGIAVGGDAVWVADTFDGTVSRIDPRTNRVVQTILVGHGPTAVAFGLHAVWVSNAGDRTVTRLDPRTGDVLATIPSGADGQSLTVGAGSVWVVDQSSDRVMRISTHPGRVVAAIPVGTGPIAVTFAFGSVWVANTFDGTISRIDTQRNVVVGTVPVGGSPVGVAAAGGRLWAADGFAGRLVAINPTTNLVVRGVEVGSLPVAITAGGTALWMSVQPAPGSHRGGTLRMTSPLGWLDSIDPALAYTAWSWNALIMTNDGLVTFRRAGGSDGTQVVPDLAASIPEAQDGGTSWTFTLRRGIHYSTGRLVQPADFRYALERLFKLHSPGTWAYAGLVGAAACGVHPSRCDLREGVITDTASRTVTFHLTAADPEFLDKLALPFADAVPARTSPIHPESLPLPATGPYKISDYVPHRSVKLVRNPYFKVWSSSAQPDGYPDRILWNASLPADASTTAIEQGRTDVMFGNPPATRLDEVETQYASQLHWHPYAAEHYIFMNNRVPPFNDLRVRRALNYALDRGEIVRLHGGRRSAEPTCQLIPPLLPGHSPYCPYTRGPTANGAWTEPDLVTARKLIAASGTHGMRVVVWSLNAEPFQSEMRYVTSVLRGLGYRATITFPGDTRYFATINDSRSRAQVGEYSWIADYPNPSDFINRQFRCDAFQPASPANVNVSGFCDATTDALISKAEALVTTDSQAANRLWAQVDRRIVNQAAYAPEYVPRAIDFVSRRVGNYQFSPQWGILVDQLWVR